MSNKTTPPSARPVVDFSAGTREDWRDDAEDFPEEAIGELLGDWEGEHWLDVNNEVNIYARARPCVVRSVVLYS